MKSALSVLIIGFVLITFAGVVFAMEMSGEVTAVDPVKGTLTLKTETAKGTVEAGFDCEEGSILKDVKVGDKVTVEYKEKDGKKIATKVTPMKKKAGGGY